MTCNWKKKNGISINRSLSIFKFLQLHYVILINSFYNNDNELNKKRELKSTYLAIFLEVQESINDKS